MQGRQRASHSGAAREAHAEAAAERCLGMALRALGLEGRELRELARGAPEKAARGWWLRQNGIVSLAWVADRLAMGHPSRVSQAVTRMRLRPGRRLRQRQRVLCRLSNER